MRKIKITTRGCPWQDIEQSPLYDFPKGKYGWNPFKVLGWGRYGGNWAIKFGIEIGSQRTNIHFGLGTIEINYPSNKPAQRRPVTIQRPPIVQEAVDYRAQVQASKAAAAVAARDALAAEGITWKEFNNGVHLRVTDKYDFFPTTGLYIHRKSGRRGHGVKGLIAAINKDVS